MKRRAFLSFLAGIPVLGPLLRVKPQIADEILSSTVLTDAGEYTFTCYNGTVGVSTNGTRDFVFYSIKDGYVVESKVIHDPF